ncbi:DUF1015 domain-containing protein [Fulvivirgaceae bacterium BMA10]|uniref:DUF1015 domain-containing protein n=1 Tax=Splendidivirga corallicola TaxID=3051826 RepID=A0ABT8KIC2_9BACT|nr:DUF1015 domain-containing protein [Fulvivirgaceae bacterium BMA10]
MAEIKPIRAWRYNRDLTKKIEELTSPLFDVVSDKQRQKLYQNPYNSIHLSVPLGEDPSLTAQATLEEWKRNKIIYQDLIPGIYVYYQYFTLPGSDREYCRKGFICNIRAYDWDEKVILRHENTMPKAVNDRIELLEKTELNASSTHGLYSDVNFELEAYMDESMLNPIYETEDYQGVRDVLSVIHDAKIVRRFVELIAEKEIILADGHHRYEGSLAYKHQRIKSNPHHTGDEGYNFHSMFLTNMEADDLRILPTHRLIKGINNLDEEEVLRKLENYFTIKPVENPHDINEIILGKKWAFGLVFKENAYKVRLIPDKIKTLSWAFPDEIKELDLTVMHYFIIEKALGIPGKDQTRSDNIIFDRSFADCLTKVIKDEVQLAIITKDISMKEVKKVCFSGYTLPQKSTYFYPKVICGFLFSSLREDEFEKETDFSI